MPLRILHIIDRLDCDGPPHQLSLLVRGLPRSEFESHVCTLRPSGVLTAELTSAGISVTSVHRRWKFDPFALGRLEQTIARLQPDIVQTWQFAANSYGRIAALRRKVKHLVAVEQHLDHTKRWPEWQLDRRLAERTSRLVANSSVVRDFCIAHGVGAERWDVIPSGVEGNAECGMRNAESPTFDSALRTPHSEFSPDSALRTPHSAFPSLALPENPRLFGAIGPLRPEMNFKEAIWTTDIAKILYKDVHLLILGDGPQRHRLERFAVDIKIPERVHFLATADLALGFPQRRVDLSQLVPHFHLLMLTSEHEGAPFAALLAMQAGVPVVATDTPAHRELIVDGEHGLLVPVGNRAGFARAVHRLIEQPDLARRLGEAGRQRVLTHYRADIMVARYAALYRSLVARDPPPQPR